MSPGAYKERCSKSYQLQHNVEPKNKPAKALDNHRSRISQSPKNWFQENPILAFNFVFWVIAHSIADGVFKGLSTYQSTLKSLDIQAIVFGLELDYKCYNMEQSMSHHRDPNTLLKLDMTSLTTFKQTDEVIAINKRIAFLTSTISRNPSAHPNLVAKRNKLYSRKAKYLLAWKIKHRQDWWDSVYNKYISGNKFAEYDKTPLFNIFKKYIPEHARLDEFLFTETTLESDIG
ncbi:hypothetical protein N7470_002629 [Penicillium chermesinum]|nr:hypothetical protein N7470_002629 [Penicillium chermesinum]